jgi:K+-sensing histidine kinase KdpD
VTNPAAGAVDRPPPAQGAALPRAGGLPARRRRLGLLLVAVALPALTAALVPLRGHLSLGSVLLLYLLLVVAASVVGAVVAGVAASAASFLLANYFLTPPYRTLDVERGDNVLALAVFLVVAVTISVLVEVAARRRSIAARSRAEAVLLGRAATEPLTARSAQDVLQDVASSFGLSTVALVQRRGDPGTDTELARVGPRTPGPASVSVPAGGDRWLLGHGRVVFAEDRHLLGELARAASRAVDVRTVAAQAQRAAELAAIDELRSALLAAVGHDLRTPLAGLVAAVETLRDRGLALTDADRDQLLDTVAESAHRLGSLLEDLLDLSRLQAGALPTDLRAVPLDEVVARALLDRQLPDVDNAVGDDLPLVLADPALLERVVANLTDNARRHTAPGTAVRVSARATPATVELSVVDHGHGVDEADWPRMFLPFQRLDDHPARPGVGLGLAIARGFTEAMGGCVGPTSTPGGGLTMTVVLPRAGAGDVPDPRVQDEGP